MLAVIKATDDRAYTGKHVKESSQDGSKDGSEDSASADGFHKRRQERSPRVARPFTASREVLYTTGTQ